jgi:hypothetical protein
MLALNITDPSILAGVDPQWHEAVLAGRARITRGGFIQFEDCAVGHGYQVIAFGWKHDTCSVLRADGTTATVPIDDRNRIFVDGRWFGSEHWNH